MNKKRIIFIAVIVAVLIIIVIGFFVFIKNKTKGGSETIPVNKSENPSEADISKNPSDQPDKTKIAEKADESMLIKSQLTLQARSFIERYATYSSDGKYSNLEELLPQMSETLVKEAKTKISQGFGNNVEFFGQTARIMSLNLGEFLLDQKAVFSGQVQVEQTVGKETSIFYQTVDLTMDKQGSEWKVSVIEYKNL